MKQFLSFIMLFIGVGYNSAQQNSSFSLEEAINYALINSSEIKISQNNIKDADKQILERRSYGLPRLNGSISYNHFAVIPVTILPEEFAIDPATGKPNPEFDRSVQFGVKNNLTGGLSLTSLIFDGSYLVGLQAAKYYRSYVSEEMASKQYQVKNQVTMAYLPVLLINLSIETLDKNIQNLKKLSEEIKAVFNQGFAEQLDVDRIELSLYNLTAEKDNLLRQKEITTNYLKFIMNYPVDKELQITDNLASLAGLPSDELLSGKINYNTRPEYKVIQKGLELNELNIKLNKAGYLPSLSAFANYQYTLQGQKLFSDNDVWAPTSIIGGQMNIPIFDGFEKKAKIERAKIQMLNVLEQKNMFEKSVEMEVSNARKSYQTATERLAIQQKNIALAEKIYNTTKTKYQQGLGSSIEITQAEQSLYTSQQNYNQALYEIIAARLNLNKAFGN